MHTIIGAGISGLSAAYFLKMRGVSSEIIEATAEIGGRIRTSSSTGPSINIGAQYLSKRDIETLKLIRDLGLDNRLLPQNLNFSYLLEGSSFEAPFEIIMHLPLDEKIQVIRFYFDWVILPEAIWTQKADELQKIDFYTWYCQKYGKESIWFYEAIIRGTTSPSTKEISAYNGVNLIQAMLSTPYNFQDGLTVLTSKLATMTQIQNKLPLKKVHIRNNRVTKLELNNKIIYKPEECILAIPAKQVAQVVDHPAYEVCNKIEYTSSLYVLIESTKPLFEGESHYIFADKHSPIGTVLNRANGGRHLYGIIMPSTQNDIAKIEKINELIKYTLSQFSPYTEDIKIVELIEWKQSLPKLNPKLHRIQKKIQNLPIENLHLIGDYTEIPSIEGAVISGKKIASKLRRF